eukprot:gene25517-54556_t
MCSAGSREQSDEDAGSPAPRAPDDDDPAPAHALDHTPTDRMSPPGALSDATHRGGSVLVRPRPASGGAREPLMLD